MDPQRTSRYITEWIGTKVKHSGLWLPKLKTLAGNRDDKGYPLTAVRICSGLFGERMRSENVKDIAALGGNPVYFLVGGLFWFFGQPQVTYQLIVSLILCYMLTTLFRMAFFRQRPLKQQYKNFLERIDASSFPSLHSMRAAVISVTIGMFFSQPLVWILAAGAAVSAAITRGSLVRLLGTSLRFSIWISIKPARIK